MDRRPLEVVSLSKREFENLRAYPDNTLFFVYEEYVSEDKQAKMRIRLYKGRHLICGDLYESILKMSKEIKELQENGGGSGDGDVVLANDLVIGNIYNTNEEFPQAKIVYDEETKKNRLNIGFPLRYTILSNNKEYKYPYSGTPDVKIYDLYPKELHDRLLGIPFSPVSQLLPNRKNDGSNFYLYANDDFVFIEDYSPLTKENTVKAAPYTPCLYKRYPDENMAIDYHRSGNALYPVIRGGSVYRPVHKDDQYIGNNYSYDYIEEEDKYTYPIRPYGTDDDDNIVATVYADKNEFSHNGDNFFLKGQSGTIDIVFDKPFWFFDSLKRFWIRFTMNVPDRIEFKGINNKGEYYKLFDIDTKQKEDIEFTSYGIRCIDNFLRQCESIIYAKDMKDLHWIYNPNDIRKISFVYEKDRIGDEGFLPWFFLRKGSFIDIYKFDL